MRLRLWLVLLAALPLLTVGSGATAGTSPAASPQKRPDCCIRWRWDLHDRCAAREDLESAGNGELGEPAWSPDGSLLAVVGWDDSGSNVYTMRPDGSERRLVFRNAWSPSWSPDGRDSRSSETSAGAAFSSPSGRTAAMYTRSLTMGKSAGAGAGVVARREVDRILRGEGAVQLVSPRTGPMSSGLSPTAVGAPPGLRTRRTRVRHRRQALQAGDHHFRPRNRPADDLPSRDSPFRP